MKFVFCLIGIIYSLHSYAAPISAIRDLETDYSTYMKKISVGDEKYLSPLSTAKIFQEENLPSVTSWSSYEVMQERFEIIRDSQFLVWKKRPEMKRRIPWLYPTDGCWIRAVLFNREAFRLYAPLPQTIYAFGNLSMETPNHRWGKVGWWFHVASIVQVRNEKFVMDPSMEMSRPLPVKEWVERMGDPQKIKVAVCGSATFSPGDNCAKETNGMELTAVSASQFYLGQEWENLKTLGRNPEQELGGSN